MNWRRRLRGVAGMAAIWAVAYLPLSLLFIVRMAIQQGGLPNLRSMRIVAEGALLIGAVSGAVFGILLALAERRRTLATLSARRMAFWGVVAALLPVVVPLIWATYDHPSFWRATGEAAVILSSVVMVGVAGAVSAGTIIYVARRGAPAVDRPDDRPELSGGKSA